VHFPHACISIENDPKYNILFSAKECSSHRFFIFILLVSLNIMWGLPLQLCDALFQMKSYSLLGLEARSVFPTTKWNIFPE
jgi:hypothetical protein